MSHALATVLHRGRKAASNIMAACRCSHGRAVSDDFGIVDDFCEWMTRAQISSEGALTGNDAPENRGVQAGRPLSERQRRARKRRRTRAGEVAIREQLGHNPRTVR